MHVCVCVCARLLHHHCYTRKVQSLGVRPYCKRTKVMKRLCDSLLDLRGTSGEKKKSLSR